MSEAPPNRAEGETPGREYPPGQFGAGLGARRGSSLRTLVPGTPWHAWSPHVEASAKAHAFPGAVKGPTFQPVPKTGWGPGSRQQARAEQREPSPGVCLTHTRLDWIQWLPGTQGNPAYVAC